MTNEERQQTIEWLKRRPVMMPGAKRMYDLAVEALEAYLPDMNVGDMISRQAAIDELSQRYIIMDNPHYIGYNAGLDEAERVIKALPPVQTEIIHCKDCLYKKICSWKSQGATFCSFGERGKVE